MGQARVPSQGFSATNEEGPRAVGFHLMLSKEIYNEGASSFSPVSHIPSHKNNAGKNVQKSKAE